MIYDTNLYLTGDSPMSGVKKIVIVPNYSGKVILCDGICRQLEFGWQCWKRFKAEKLNSISSIFS